MQVRAGRKESRGASDGSLVDVDREREYRIALARAEERPRLFLLNHTNTANLFFHNLSKSGILPSSKSGWSTVHRRAEDERGPSSQPPSLPELARTCVAGHWQPLAYYFSPSSVYTPNSLPDHALGPQGTKQAPK